MSQAAIPASNTALVRAKNFLRRRRDCDGPWPTQIGQRAPNAQEVVLSLARQPIFGVGFLFVGQAGAEVNKFFGPVVSYSGEPYIAGP